MMADYKLFPQSIRSNTEGSFIPIDLKNRDYQEYLKWVAKGGIADPADFIPDALPPTASQITTVVLRDDPVFRALLKVIAVRFNIPVAQLVDEIKAQV